MCVGHDGQEQETVTKSKCIDRERLEFHDPTSHTQGKRKGRKEQNRD